jgi:RHS repeat-associated protein
MQRNVVSTLVLTILLGATLAASADAPEMPPPGMGKYVIVLWSPGTPVPGDSHKRIPDVPEPDVTKHGGRELDRSANRRIVYLPFAAAKQLRRHEAVAFIQRLWMGESLDAWNEGLPPASAAKIATDADTGLQWGPKTYLYDDSGNITKIGSDEYTYDSAGRLIKATVNGKTETYKYDAFGNLAERAVSGTNPVQIAVDPASNRLAGAAYDATGNVITRDGRASYAYDSLNMLSYVEGASTRRMLYDASDEQIGTFIDSLSRWTVRDLEGQVLREYRGDDLGFTMRWYWDADYIRGEGQLVAGETQTWTYNGMPGAPEFGGERHYHLDHLGSVRMVTDRQGRSLTEHEYFPFGTTQTQTYQEPINPASPHTDSMRFAGHTRDFLGYMGIEGSDYLDSMHARYYDPNVGRFLSVDPEPASVSPADPQTWNRYSYAYSSPLNYHDPDGRCAMTVIDENRQVAAHTDDSIFCVEVSARAEAVEKSAKQGQPEPPTDFINTLILGGSFFVKLDGPALSKYNTGRLFQVRFGNDPNKPMMIRVDYKAMSQGQDPRLHVNIQQQGKGSKGLNKHISIDPRDLAKSLGNRIKIVPVLRPPFVPVFNPCMLNPGLCADRWDTST